MKNILVLLSLIYFISCSTEYCNILQDVESPNDCLYALPSDENNNCCFIQVGVDTVLGHQSVKVCYEFNKKYSIDEIRTALDYQYKQADQILEDLKC